MARLKTLFECIARSLCDSGWALTSRPGPIADALPSIIRLVHRSAQTCLPENQLRDAWREAASAPQATVDLEIQDAISAVVGGRSDINRAALTAFLEIVQPSARQALRRPGDPTGVSVPEELRLEKPEDWLIFLPERLTRFQVDEKLASYDNWLLHELRGFGPYSNAWMAGGESDSVSEPALLKFIRDPRAAMDFARFEAHFRRVLDLKPIGGLVPLRTVYLLADPPCLHYSFVHSYDVGGLIRDWRWRNERPKPDQASVIIKRVARVAGHLHALGPPVVHRGLKPSNLLIHPTAEGKVTVWVSDIGWGEISASLAMERTEQVDAMRQARRGSLATRYASPQQLAGEPPDPRDDVYAMGAIWYQLLKRDATAVVPDHFEWVHEFRKYGLSDGHVHLLAACLDPDRDARPANGFTLAAQIDAHFSKPPDQGSKTFPLKGSSLSIKLPESLRGDRRIGAIIDEHRTPARVKNSIGMEFARIGPGSFEMGSPEEEKGRQRWEGPVHAVNLTRPFYMALHPVTQAQFQSIMSRNPSHFTPTLGGGPTNPVEQVTWEDAVEFCHRLMELSEEKAESRIYRLPTEAEWEYACRAGSRTAFAFGDAVTLHQVHYLGLNAATWARSANSAGKTMKVGTLRANAWNLHDMHGNILEWCHDWWCDTWYAESPTDDPQGPKEGSQRVVRGGSFAQFATDCRSAARLGRDPSSRLNTIGFRVVMQLLGS